MSATRTSSKPTEIDVESSRVTMSPAKLAAIIAASVAAATFLSNTIAASASRSDVLNALSIHGQRPHAATEERLHSLEISNARQADQLARLERVPDQLAALVARVELLVYESEPEADPDKRRKAAQRVRRAARKRGEDRDPLEGVEGL